MFYRQEHGAAPRDPFYGGFIHGRLRGERGHAARTEEIYFFFRFLPSPSCLPASLSPYSSVSLFVCLLVYLPHPSVCLRLCFCLSIYPSLTPFLFTLRLFRCFYIYLCIYLYLPSFFFSLLCMSVSLFIFLYNYLLIYLFLLSFYFSMYVCLCLSVGIGRGKVGVLRPYDLIKEGKGLGDHTTVTQARRGACKLSVVSLSCIICRCYVASSCITVISNQVYGLGVLCLG